MVMEAREREIVLYNTADGKVPFEVWFEKLKSNTMKEAVRARLERLRSGNFGDYKPVGEGVSELRFASGLRIYFADIGGMIVLLFSGGDKSSQAKDIRKAKEFLREFKNR